MKKVKVAAKAKKVMHEMKEGEMPKKGAVAKKVKKAKEKC